MKQLIFMIAATALGTIGVFVWEPFYGVFVYYLFAVLRPQFLWYWALPDDRARNFNWSFWVALATILAAVLCALGVWNVRGVRHDPTEQDEDESATHRLSWAHRAVLLFAVWIGVTYLTARNQQAADYWFVEYCKIFLMYAVSWYLIRSFRQVWMLFVMVVLTLSYICYEINFLYFFRDHYLGIYHNGFGGMDNNAAGLMLAMGMPLCWFAFEGTRRWWRWAFLPLIPVIIHAVLMTYSRGAMLSMIVVVPFLLLRTRHRLQLCVALVCFALAALPLLAGEQIKARFLTIEQNEIDESANSRRKAWRAALLIALDNPIVGVGVRNSNLISQQYGADMEGRTIHSQFLQIAADNGFVGLALYAFVLGAAWFSLRRCRRMLAGRADAEARQVLACVSGLECSLILYAFGSLFLSLEVFELPYLLLLLAAQLGVVGKASALNGGAAVIPVSESAREFNSEEVPARTAEAAQPW